MDIVLKNNLSEKNNKSYQIAIWVIVGLGILFRLFHYFDDRSLWEDEIYLSTGLVKLSLVELFTKTLDFQQKAPMGYAVMAKLCLMMLGNNEMGLRLYPLICGIAAVLIAVPVGKYFFKPVGALVMIALVALAPTMIYHSVEAKQYGTEAMATILILWLYTKYHDKSDAASLIKWALAGAVIVWFSYSSVFVFAGVAVTVGLPLLLKRQWNWLFKLIFVAIAWFGSFILYYLIFTAKDAHSPWLVWFFESHDAFVPRSGKAITWLLHRFIAFYNYPSGLSWALIYDSQSALKQMLTRMVFVPIILTVIGVCYLFRANRRLLLLVGSIFGIVLFASFIKLYPFHERLTMFLTPLVFLILAAGCDGLFSKSTSTKLIWQTILVLMLLFGPVKTDIAQVLNPGLLGEYKKSYQSEALTMVEREMKPGDLIYVYWNDLPGYHFYKLIHRINFTAIEGKDRRFEAKSFDDYFTRLDQDLAPLKGHNRVWVIQNRGIDIVTGEFVGDPAWYYKYNDGAQRFMDHISGMGKEVEHFIPTHGNPPDISVRLMDFSVK